MGGEKGGVYLQEDREKVKDFRREEKQRKYLFPNFGKKSLTEFTAENRRI